MSQRMPADAPLTEPGTLVEGAVIDGRYRIVGLMGRGGMGSVYRAEHTTIRRPVALKVLHPELTVHPEFARRFEREAFAAGQLRHPNCVAVSDFGHGQDGMLYLVMELLEGESLRDRLRSGALGVPRAVHVTRQILGALVHAHAQGIVHRDMKPDNVILVEQDGDRDFAKVLDFGIAMLRGAAADLSGGETLTQAGMTIGTPAYLSPEQAYGEAVDHRTDVYAVGVMLFEMIAGYAPFRGANTMALLAAHATAPIPSLAAAAPGQGVTPALEALVSGALAKRVEDRVPTAEVFLAALEQLPFASPGPSVAPPAASPSRLVRAVPSVFTPTQLGVAATAIAPAPRRRPTPTRAPFIVLSAIVIAALIATLVVVTSKHPGGRAAPMLRLHTAADDDDHLKAAMLDLDKGETCDARRAAVARLRAIADKRALPALKRARYRGRGGVLGIGEKNANACLRDDADAAIAYLTARP